MITLTKTYRLMWDPNTMIVLADPTTEYNGITLVNDHTDYLESDEYKDISDYMKVAPLIWSQPTDDEPGSE